MRAKWYLIVGAMVLMNCVRAWGQEAPVHAPFTLVKEESGAMWLMNSVTGSLRFCKSEPSKVSVKCSDWIGPGPGQPGGSVVYATISVNCGSKTYELSTGNNSGACTTDTGPDGNTGGKCGDNAGNTSSVTCHKDGTGACSAAIRGAARSKRNKSAM
jgi:hypothetical protein